MSAPHFLAVLLALVAAGCAESGREVGHATFTGQETHELTVTLASAGAVHFDTTVEVRLRTASGDDGINEEWQYTIETVRGGNVARTTTCDALNVAPSLGSSVQSGDLLRLSRSRLLGCNVTLDSGVSTLRMTLSPMRGSSGITPVKVDVFVMR